jgi:hypothetical protein
VGFFDAHVPAGLAWVRQHGQELVASVDNNLTTSLALVLQVHLGSSWRAALPAAAAARFLLPPPPAAATPYPLPPPAS